MQRLLLLDRDGVINEESPAFIKSPREWVPLPGSLRAIGEATRAGFRICVVSNQSGLARGLFDIDDLNAIHRRLVREAAQHGGLIDAFFFCPHGPREACECRKPRPGLVKSVAERAGMSLAAAVMIGDRTSDIVAAQTAGVRAVLVLTGHGQATRAALAVGVCPVYADLAAAVAALCRGEL